VAGARVSVQVVVQEAKMTNLVQDGVFCGKNPQERLLALLDEQAALARRMAVEDAYTNKQLLRYAEDIEMQAAGVRERAAAVRKGA
jgi:hypothetical protein